MKTLAAIVVTLCLATPAFADDGVTGFWITLGWPSTTGALLFLFAAFCALWAQNTRRNPWLWFFLGLLFHILTVLALLTKNAHDHDTARR